MAYIFGLCNMASLLAKLNDRDSEEYSDRADELTRILNEKFFEGDRYVRAVTDAGRLIGSKKEKEGRIYIEPQGWALFTGVADARKAKSIVAAMRRELYVPYGVMLLSPPYTKYREDVGRISNDPPGIVENGSNYVQGMLFYTYGLVRAGMPDEAHELLHRVLPTNPDNPPEKALIEPFQITNSFQGPASKHPGRALFSWRTGSAGWFIKTVWDGMLGIRPDFDELEIDARLPRAFGDRVQAVRNIRGRKINFEFVKSGAGTKGDSSSIQVPNGSRLSYENLKNVSLIQVMVS
jgi:cellobionic acid phosphorylase